LTAYIIRRLLETVVILLIVSVLVFLGMRFLPGDPILLLVSEQELGGMTDERIELLRHEYGLDKSIVVQYFDWVGGLFHGDLGKSIYYHTTVTDEMARRLPVTLYLGAIAFIITVILGIPAGVISAVRRAKFTDTVVTTLANIGITVPNFWLGFILVFIFGLKLKVLPVFGFVFPFEDFTLSIKQTIMPVICLSIAGIAGITRQTRSTMLEVIRQDYIRTAWSKGLKERTVIIGHAMKNGLIPVVTLIGMQVRVLVGGAVFVETVFNIPGMGRLATDAVFSQDYTVIQGVTMVTAVVVTLSNLLVDISYCWLDPRIRYR
jgi:peptide/nickel transport system permease protein